MLLINVDHIVLDPLELEKMDPYIKNGVYKRLEKGFILFLVPEDFPLAKSKNPKHLRNVYKVGFIFQCLSIMYPEYDKTKKFKIISKKYHFDFSYRRFITLLNTFEQDKKKFIKKRSSL